MAHYEPPYSPDHYQSPGQSIERATLENLRTAVVQLSEFGSDSNGGQAVFGNITSLKVDSMLDFEEVSNLQERPGFMTWGEIQTSPDESLTKVFYEVFTPVESGVVMPVEIGIDTSANVQIAYMVRELTDYADNPLFADFRHKMVYWQFIATRDGRLFCIDFVTGTNGHSEANFSEFIQADALFLLEELNEALAALRDKKCSNSPHTDRTTGENNAMQRVDLGDIDPNSGLDNQR